GGVAAAGRGEMLPPRASVLGPLDRTRPATVMAPPALSVIEPPELGAAERSIRLSVLPLASSVMSPVVSISRLDGAAPVAPVMRAPGRRRTDPARIWTLPAPRLAPA